ncbi:MAG: hypothetical protein VX417_05175, partial [SAR324 cluster bacterium]|nr:hypothetical protein [SAR324 cluster bacterium]
TDVYVPFFEVHGNKFSRDKNGKLQAHHCFLSEYDNLVQEKDVTGKTIPEAAKTLLNAFKTYVEQNDIWVFDTEGDFDKGIQQYKDQFQLTTGETCNAKNSSLKAPYVDG